MSKVSNPGANSWRCVIQMKGEEAKVALEWNSRCRSLILFNARAVSPLVIGHWSTGSILIVKRARACCSWVPGMLQHLKAWHLHHVALEKRYSVLHQLPRTRYSNIA